MIENFKKTTHGLEDRICNEKDLKNVLGSIRFENEDIEFTIRYGPFVENTKRLFDQTEEIKVYAKTKEINEWMLSLDFYSKGNIYDNTLHLIPNLSAMRPAICYGKEIDRFYALVKQFVDIANEAESFVIEYLLTFIKRYEEQMIED